MTAHRAHALAPFASALLLGGLAAALPSWLAQPEGELSALRGVAAGAVALLVALALALAWGANGPRPLREEAGLLLRLALAAGAALLPALLAGVAWSELRSLSTLLQRSLGWREHLPIAVLAAFLLAVAFTTSRLWHSLRRSPLSGPIFPTLAGLGATLFLVTAAWRLGSIPARVGLERLEKLTALVLLATLLVAAFTPARRAARGYDGRALALAVGVLVSAIVGSEFARRYSHPRPSDLRDVVASRTGPDQTLLTSTVRGRPDIYGLFVLPNASDSVRLAYACPIEGSPWANVDDVKPERWGFARLEFGAPLPQREGERGSGSVEARWPEVWFSVASPFRFELRSGIRIRARALSWAVLPNRQAVVASTYEQEERLGDRRFGASGLSDATYAVSVWRGFWGILGPRTLLADLPLPPRILEVSDRTVRLLVAGATFHRGKLRTAGGSDGGGLLRASTWGKAPPIVGTTLCDLRSMSCEPWRIVDGRLAAAAGRGPRLVVLRSEGWTVLETETLAPLYSVPYRGEPARPGSDRVFLLSGGGLLRISLLGRMPDWDARVAAFDLHGKLLGELALGNVRLIRFAGDLADGSVAIAWRTRYSYSLSRSPVFGWVLEAWNPRTGERRRLADDVATLPSPEDDPSRVFLDRSGRLVTPTAGGLVDIRDHGGW